MPHTKKHYFTLSEYFHVVLISTILLYNCIHIKIYMRQKSININRASLKDKVSGDPSLNRYPRHLQKQIILPKRAQN